MPTFQIPEYLQEFTDQNASVVVDAGDLNVAFEQLFTLYPGLRPQIFSPEGGVRPFLMVFIGNYHIDALNGLRTVLQSDDQITMLVNLAGG
ncbi:MAG TPA: molybdopterin synthase sulfur carrier subunit [Anaerolineaceae bacterium]|jgi:molybdopterin converting factor small subunit|nr:molybdopterin synthase sulfur carrier subunit [Anaerolineaceae bacterium]